MAQLTVGILRSFWLTIVKASDQSSFLLMHAMVLHLLATNGLCYWSSHGEWFEMLLEFEMHMLFDLT